MFQTTNQLWHWLHGFCPVAGWLPFLTTEQSKWLRQKNGRCLEPLTTSRIPTHKGAFRTIVFQFFEFDFSSQAPSVHILIPGRSDSKPALHHQLWHFVVLWISQLLTPATAVLWAPAKRYPEISHPGKTHSGLEPQNLKQTEIAMAVFLR